MEWHNNLSVSNLFLSHDVNIEGDDGIYTIHIPSLKEYAQSPFYSQFLHLFDAESLDQWRTIMPDVSKAHLLQLLMTEPRITNLKEFRSISHLLYDNLSSLIIGFNVKERKLYCNDSPITDNALSEILYILKLGIGQKVEAPQHFGPGEEQARLFYERAERAKRKINKIREENKKSSELVDMFSLIVYKFPMYTFEELYAMTIMQLHYLQNMASKMLSYEHGMTAYLAGNLKKPPQFFLK